MIPGAEENDPYALRSRSEVCPRCAAHIPGLKPDEVKIEVEDDILTVTGEHEERKEEKDKQFVRRRRRYGSFSRSLALPTGVDAATIKAETHDGILEVTVPLPKEAKKEIVTITPTVV